MKAFNVVVTDPIMIPIHIIRFALRKPNICPVLFLFELANLVIAEESRCLGEVAESGVLMSRLY